MSPHKRNAVYYFFANALASLLPFVMVLLLTHKLSQLELGLYSMFQIVMVVGLPLVSLQLTSVLGREYTTRTTEDFRRYIGSCMWISLCAFLLVAFICILFNDLLEKWLELNIVWCLLALLCAAGQGMTAIMFFIRTMQRKPISYAIWRIGSAFSLSFFPLIAIFFWQSSWQAVAIVQAIVSIMLIAVCLVVLRRQSLLGTHFNGCGADYRPYIRIANGGY